MKRLLYVLPIISILVIVGCNKNVVEPPVVEEVKNVDEIKEELKEEIKQEIIEELKEEEKKEPELTEENYDYKDDPDTIVVKIDENNIDEYFSLIVYEYTNKEGKTLYSVVTHSLMYDDGYVCVGYENASITFGRGFYYEVTLDTLLEPTEVYCWDIFNYEACWLLNDKTKAEEYANKGIKYYEPNFESDEATLYFQKIEDVKYGYEIKDGVRIVNGEEKEMLDSDNPY